MILDAEGNFPVLLVGVLVLWRYAFSIARQGLFHKIKELMLTISARNDLWTWKYRIVAH